MLELNADARLAAVREKVEAGKRLSFDDGVFLYDHADLFTLGELANTVRERKNGNFTYYNVNTHLNPTNVCVYRCTFCAFRADLKSPKATSCPTSRSSNAPPRPTAAAPPSCTSSAACTTSCPTTGISTSSALSTAPIRGCTSRPTRPSSGTGSRG